MAITKHDFCLCGHTLAIHEKRNGMCGISYEQPNDMLKYVVRHECLKFQLDNLKYLERRHHAKK